MHHKHQNFFRSIALKEKERSARKLAKSHFHLFGIFLESLGGLFCVFLFYCSVRVVHLFKEFSVANVGIGEKRQIAEWVLFHLSFVLCNSVRWSLSCLSCFTAFQFQSITSLFLEGKALVRGTIFENISLFLFALASCVRFSWNIQVIRTSNFHIQTLFDRSVLTS